MLRLLIDMNLSPAWVDLLQQSGFDAVHWSTVGSSYALDAEIMQYARQNGFIILTHDLDFGVMLATTQSKKPSVIQIRAENVSVNTIGNYILKTLNKTASELENGALLTIDLHRMRLRLLPFQ